jgi:NAD(P)-dependent dehydrogenase (short-subunit alcohol dehydrogenase family)
MDFRLDGKTALVTGGSRGIGKGIAKAFVESGARVMITSRKAEACEAAASEIGCSWSAGHVGRPEDAARVIDETISELGGVDILVNNAATNPYAGPLIDAELAAWKKTFEVNLDAPFVWTQLAWQRYMREHGGVVINVISVGAYKTSTVLGVYGVTKAALAFMTQQLASELGPNVRVNALCPGIVETDFARLLWEGDRGDTAVKAYPLGRLGQPEDIAGAAVFLASDASSWITGQVTIIDGGNMVSSAVDL